MALNPVVRAASSTDNAIVRFDGASGGTIQSSVGILSDAGDVTGITVNANVITAGTVDIARLGSGASSVNFLRGDSTFAVPAGLQCPLMISGSVYDIADFWGGYRNLLTAGGTHSANKMYLYPFICKQTVTVTKFSFQVTTAVGASNARCGFYADSVGVPTGAALVDTGNMSTAAVAVVDSSTISYQLVAGTAYWWAVAVSANVAFQGYNGTWIPTVGAATTGDATIYNAYRMDHAFGALPTIGALTRVSVSAPPRFQVVL